MGFAALAPRATHLVPSAVGSGSRAVRSAAASAPTRPLGLPVQGLYSHARRTSGRCRAGDDDVQQGTKTEMDFDAYLAMFADKWEASDNKAVVAGYGIGAIFAFFFAEYLIHLPLFNILLGFPLQLIGLLMAPYLGIRYFIDGKDYMDDVTMVYKAVTAKLPGLNDK